MQKKSPRKEEETKLDLLLPLTKLSMSNRQSQIAMDRSVLKQSVVDCLSKHSLVL